MLQKDPRDTRSGVSGRCDTYSVGGNCVEVLQKRQMDLQCKRKRKEEVSSSIVAGIGHCVLHICMLVGGKASARASLIEALWLQDIGVYRLNL